MPLTINVGLSRKASKDYQSSGVSINVTAELDQSLLARPRELQVEIDRLYAQAEDGLARQADRSDEPGNGSGRLGNGRSNGGPSRTGSNGGGMTTSQERAIHAIAKRLNIDAADECHHEFGLDLKRLGIREASALIDHLKSPGQPAGRNGGGR